MKTFIRKKSGRLVLLLLGYVLTLLLLSVLMGVAGVLLQQMSMERESIKTTIDLLATGLTGVLMALLLMLLPPIHREIPPLTYIKENRLNMLQVILLLLVSRLLSYLPGYFLEGMVPVILAAFIEIGGLAGSIFLVFFKKRNQNATTDTKTERSGEA